MPSTITRTRRNRPSRRRNPAANAPQPVNPINITAATISTTVLIVTFDQPISLNGTPDFTTNLAPTPVSAVQTAPNRIEITYSATIVAATEVNVGYRDPAIRNASGGFVTNTVFPLV